MSTVRPIVGRLVKAYRPMQWRGLLLDGRLPQTQAAASAGASPPGGRRVSLIALVVSPLARFINERSSSC